MFNLFGEAEAFLLHAEEILNPKLQILNKFKAPSTNDQNIQRTVILRPSLFVILKEP
jgi:hypothetical protein